MTNQIAVIGTRGYPSYYGGFETAIRRIAPYLADQGMDVTVYGRKNATKAGEADPRITRVETLGLETKSLSTLSYGLTSVIHACWKKPDVALIMNVANGYWLPLLKLRRIPTIVNVDGIEWDRAKWGPLAKLVFKTGAKLTAKFADELVSDSLAIRHRWQTEFDVDSHFIPYGGDEPGTLPVPEGLTHRGYILFVARFVAENTVNEFLEAAKELSLQHPVVIVGSSGYGGEFDVRARELDDNYENISWLGHVSDDSLLHALWQHAGTYFHGHSVGGTNPALVQAMACGTPTVARETVYNREVLAQTAHYSAPVTKDIVKQCLDLMSDSTEQAALSEATFLRSRIHYSWTGVCEAYNQLLSKYCGTQSGPTSSPTR